MSPHGILPVLKHGRVVPIGCDDITRHLEKVSSKVARLSTAKKKHIAPTLHCKTTIEPLVEQLLDPVNSEQSPLLVKLFYHELGTLESAIKGPFYSSSGFSMVGSSKCTRQCTDSLPSSPLGVNPDRWTLTIGPYCNAFHC